jgi:FkbM family methyltransferase
MKQIAGIWIPDGESYLAPHLADTEGYADEYDADLFEFVVPRQFRTAIDVGANIGLWSRKLAKKFAVVHAFEPLGTARECFVLNVEAPNVHLHEEALGDRSGTTEIFSSTITSFKTHVNGSSGGVELRTLDSFGFTEVDFIKIDCEGFDYFVLHGARKTIERERPIIIFESKPQVSLKRYRVQQEAPHRLVESLGYLVRSEPRGNVICYPQERAVGTN